MELKEALQTLDPANDEHWTSAGLPRVDFLVQLTGKEDLRRSDVEEAAPKLNRESFVGYAFEASNQQDPVNPPTDPEQSPDDESTPNEGQDKPGEDTQPNQGDDDEPSNPKESEDEEAPVQETVEEKLARELSEKQAEMADITKAQAELDKRRKLLAREIGYIGTQLDRARSSRPVDSGIKQYLESQNKLREEKVAKMKALKESGVTELLTNLGVSKLDAAMMQRKPALGSQRPKFN